MNPLRTVPLLFFLVFVLSCSTSRKENVVDRAKFARVFAALTKHGVSVHTPGFDSTVARKSADSILKAWDVTRDAMIATTNELNKDPLRWKAVMEDVDAAMRDTSLH